MRRLAPARGPEPIADGRAARPGNTLGASPRGCAGSVYGGGGGLGARSARKRPWSAAPRPCAAARATALAAPATAARARAVALRAPQPCAEARGVALRTAQGCAGAPRGGEMPAQGCARPAQSPRRPGARGHPAAHDGRNEAPVRGLHSVAAATSLTPGNDRSRLRREEKADGPSARPERPLRPRGLGRLPQRGRKRTGRCFPRLASCLRRANTSRSIECPPGDQMPGTVTTTEPASPLPG